MRSHQNESLAIAGRNLFDDEASSSNNTGAKLPTPPKTLHEHSRPNSFGFQNPIIFPTERNGRITSTHATSGFDQSTSLTEEDGWNRIGEYVQYQDNLWEEPSPFINVSSISEAMQPTLRGRLKRACNQISFLETPTREVGLKNPYLICDYCGGSHEADECEQNNPSEQRNNKCKEKGEDGPEWIVRSKFEDELANFMLEKKSHAKGIGDMLVQHPMIHMPKGAKVLKDLLSHKEKLEKAALPSLNLVRSVPLLLMESTTKGRRPRKLHTTMSQRPLAD
ncbi:hypothetical protein Tco_1507039 [Tanacetum coccineum]